MIRCNANLFRIAFACSSSEETRYYLKGVYIHPHATRGVVMVTTDGHRMLVIHDEAGHADESAVINLGDALKACKPKRDTRILSIATGAKDADILAGADAENLAPVAKAFNVRIDGTFPDYERFIPSEFTDKASPTFAGRYLSAFGSIASDLTQHIGASVSRHDSGTNTPNAVRILAGAGKDPEGNPALVLFPDAPFAFGILMPVRDRLASIALPTWFRKPVKAPAIAPDTATERAAEPAE